MVDTPYIRVGVDYSGWAQRVESFLIGVMVVNTIVNLSLWYADSMIIISFALALVSVLTYIVHK